MPYGQKGGDGRSQWGTGTRETEARLDGWCESGLRQQFNVAKDRKECMESPGTYVTECAPFLLGTVFFRTALPCSGVITCRGEGCRYLMRLG